MNVIWTKRLCQLALFIHKLNVLSATYIDSTNKFQVCELKKTSAFWIFNVIGFKVTRSKTRTFYKYLALSLKRQAGKEDSKEDPADHAGSHDWINPLVRRRPLRRHHVLPVARLLQDQLVRNLGAISWSILLKCCSVDNTKNVSFCQPLNDSLSVEIISFKVWFFFWLRRVPNLITFSG